MDFSGGWMMGKFADKRKLITNNDNKLFQGG
jgi:hypothetical protein